MPISDEILVLPPALLKSTTHNAPLTFGFAILNSTPGLKFLCRESVDYGRSKYDHPLGARFEELDAVVIFDNALVPWERVFVYGQADAEDQLRALKGTMAHALYQVVCRYIAKTEFLLGLISLMIEAIGVERIQHIQEKTMETWTYLETMKAFQHAAEVDAVTNEFGFLNPAWVPLDAATNLFPRFYPRMIEIVQQVGASSLMSMPTRADVYGPLADEIRQYYQSTRLEARERIPLFRLAWDTAVSAFGSRQVLYERFFLGDPVRKAESVFDKPDRAECMEKVREFLSHSVRETEPVFFFNDHPDVKG